MVEGESAVRGIVANGFWGIDRNKRRLEFCPAFVSASERRTITKEEQGTGRK
ncbi:hypothetical protein KFK09_023266 [Dendrobium nobile]|uniref:Uncharacterized protein n=1 Tax=Dendrobium nobile TaxID=94219 RepID=A0A8T3ALF8_DENNO|nr:hypothetical protein KFK09_023266 [Dendrobium nobile]